MIPKRLSSFVSEVLSTQHRHEAIVEQLGREVLIPTLLHPPLFSSSTLLLSRLALFTPLNLCTVGSPERNETRIGRLILRAKPFSSGYATCDVASSMRERLSSVVHLPRTGVEVLQMELRYGVCIPHPQCMLSLLTTTANASLGPTVNARLPLGVPRDL
jgi:hypothetical protein